MSALAREVGPRGGPAASSATLARLGPGLARGLGAEEAHEPALCLGVDLLLAGARRHDLQSTQIGKATDPVCWAPLYHTIP